MSVPVIRKNWSKVHSLTSAMKFPESKNRRSIFLTRVLSFFYKTLWKKIMFHSRAFYNFSFDHICRKQVYGGLKIDFLLITLVFYYFLEMIKGECKFFLLKGDMIYIPKEISWFELQLLFRVFGKKIHIRGSKNRSLTFTHQKFRIWCQRMIFLTNFFKS